MRFDITDRLCDPDRAHELQVIFHENTYPITHGRDSINIPLSDEDVWDLAKAALDRIERKGLRPPTQKLHEVSGGPENPLVTVVWDKERP